MGYTEAADNYTHFSYEMVALTPRCAMDLGYTVSEEDQKRSYLEVSGRKGFGVKADDLIDRLIAAAQTEVDQRHPELDQAGRTYRNRHTDRGWRTALLYAALHSQHGDSL